MAFDIFDFDNTLTQSHTFQHARLEAFTHRNSNSMQLKGYIDAEHNLKKGLRSELKPDQFAIATFHNNPDYIAGYLRALFGKNVVKKAEPIFSEAPVVAIQAYQLEGQAQPILIAYIPEVGQQFDQRLAELEGKNNQTLFLQAELIKRGIICAETELDFFDDSRLNIVKAQTLPNVSVYEVDSYYDYFQYYLVEPPIAKSASLDFSKSDSDEPQDAASEAPSIADTEIVSLQDDDQDDAFMPTIQLLGGFIATLGISAVAAALVLVSASMMPAVTAAVVGGAGMAASLIGFGLFQSCRVEEDTGAIASAAFVP